MRGRQEPQVAMLAFVDLEERVPADHPLRTIKVEARECGALHQPFRRRAKPTKLPPRGSMDTFSQAYTVTERAAKGGAAG